jgi:glutathione S-transferase
MERGTEMGEYTLVIGNKNYSSWSMRGWLAMKQTGLPFEEIVIPLDQDETRHKILGHSPSGRVPVLKHDGRVVWDSLAILEYLAELAPGAGLWPKLVEARANARSVCAEMHSGFQALRTHMPMNIRASLRGKDHAAGVDEDIRRITQIWRDSLQRHGGGGPFLFGPWCGADAFFAPVVTRFRTYGVHLDDICRTYADRVLAWPAVAEWCEAAKAEPWGMARIDGT